MLNNNAEYRKNNPVKTHTTWLPRLLSLVGLFAAILLFTVGKFTTLHPLTMIVIFAATILFTAGGVLALAFRKARKNRCSILFITMLTILLISYLVNAIFLAEPGVILCQSENIPTLKTSDCSKQLRVVTFNVNHGYPEFKNHEARYCATRKALRALSADIIILQEVWWTRKHGHLARRLAKDLKITSYAYARANASLRFIGFEEGEAVLSRYPIRSARRLLLEPAKAWYEQRIALITKIAIGRRILTITGTHLSNNAGKIADAQSCFLAAKLTVSGIEISGDQLLIVAGDFNCGSGSSAVRAFTSQDLQDIVPGGIDHLLAPSGPRAPWLVKQSGWTLCSDNLPARINGNPDIIKPVVAISDHPGIVVDFLFRN